MPPPPPPASLRFADAVRAVAAEARRARLEVPAFRSPPRIAGVDRSLRRGARGGATVSVVVRDRPWPAVLADIVEGVVVANQLSGPDADRARARLWEALGGAGHVDGAAAA